VSLTVRKRGEKWYARGTVRVGTQLVEVPEFSTGARTRSDAEAIAAAEEARIRADVLDGPARRARTKTIADALEAYLERPGGVPDYDVERVADFNERIGSNLISEAPVAWNTWLKTRGKDMAPATAARWRAIYVSALKTGCAAMGIPEPPKIPMVVDRQQERVAHLHDDERERLIRSYNPHAAAPALLLAYAGLRTQEALQLDWREVRLQDARLRIGVVNRTKSGKARSVPLHRRPLMLLIGLHEAQGCPTRGPVFFSAKGAPYSDTRGQGGNPLSQAHETACRRARVTDFRVHDWRHDYATRFLDAGGDVRKLMQIMGWSDPRMVQRYVTFRDDQLAEIVAMVA
jgi:integrase